MWRVATNIQVWNKQSRTADKGLSSSWGAALGVVFWFHVNRDELNIFISKTAG